MKNIVSILLPLLLVLSIASAGELRADGSAGDHPRYESRYVVDMPTAGVVPKSDFALYSDFFSGGGIMVELTAAPFNNFNMGLSFSGSNIIGSGEPSWQNFPGVQIRWRIIDETLIVPAITLGLNTQGRGAFSSSTKTFETYSPGIYGAASKNFNWLLGTIAFHGGVCYSFEPLPQNRAPNLYLGLEQSLGKYASVNLEYNFRTDYNNNRSFTDKGLLNASLRWAMSDGLTVELGARDLLVHQASASGFARNFAIEYIGKF